MHQLRRESAVAAQQTSVTTFLDYCRSHAGELLEEVQAEAEAATGAYIEAQAAAEDVLRDPITRRQAAGELVRTLIPCLGDAGFPYESDWTVPEDLAATPLPQTAIEVIERAKNADAYDARRLAEADAVAREAEREAAETAERDVLLTAAQQELGHLIAKGHRGQLSRVERESLAQGKHPLQIDIERLKSGTLTEAREALHHVALANMRGLLNAADSAALARGHHPAQGAVERLATEPIEDRTEALK